MVVKSLFRYFRVSLIQGSSAWSKGRLVLGLLGGRGLADRLAVPPSPTEVEFSNKRAQDFDYSP